MAESEVIIGLGSGIATAISMLGVAYLRNRKPLSKVAEMAAAHAVSTSQQVTAMVHAETERLMKAQAEVYEGRLKEYEKRLNRMTDRVERFERSERESLRLLEKAQESLRMLEIKYNALVKENQQLRQKLNLADDDR